MIDYTALSNITEYNSVKIGIFRSLVNDFCKQTLSVNYNAIRYNLAVAFGHRISDKRGVFNVLNYHFIKA